MVTISLCMIVKDEEKVLARCLDSISDLMDEIIIVDTGSTDDTKKIAAKYTDKIYDFEWTNDFSKARNFAFSKATKEYIYSADADELLTEENRAKFKKLKEVMFGDIEIVQMFYCNDKEYNTLYNYEQELRPKLYKRLREFVWIDPIHETVRTLPVVFDSDIEIVHRPVSKHEGRDFDALLGLYNKGIRLSTKLHHMYAMELYRCGTKNDFFAAIPVFENTMEDGERKEDEIRDAICILAKAYRLKGDANNFFTYALKDAVLGSTAEVCCELGDYYQSVGNVQEAVVWYRNAATETESIIDLRTSTDIPKQRLKLCLTNEE